MTLKFRIFSKEDKKIYEVVAIDFARKMVSYKDGKNRFGVHFDDCEIMQSTGLFDKNGKEIYEADIVCIDQGLIEVIKWLGDGDWMADKQPLVGFVNHGSIYKKPIEVIGNIYENPDLLNEKKS